MSLTLGEKLRQAREARGISISEVAEQTRISALYLEAIENNDYRTLPGGIFNKGFVKSFAKFVGIDEQEALQDYSRLLAEQGTESADDPKTYRPQVLTDDQARSSMIPTLIFAVIILGLLTGGILWGLNYYQNSQNQALTGNGNTNQTANNASNTNTIVTANPTPAPPATNEINVEFRTSETVSVTYVADGRRVNRNVAPNEPLTFKAQQSARMSYFKGFADKVQLTVNGRQLAPPQAAAKRNVVEFEITKDNIAQILQSGAITPTAAP
ncbi:MAG: helix-turn-helix domain-containing protein [Acidobacteriota bacterium]|nr:helix-turn-helix domain-containing protein [Acidobacteriota bacterium]